MTLLAGRRKPLLSLKIAEYTTTFWLHMMEKAFNDVVKQLI